MFFGHSLKESGVFGLGAAYSNTVLIGIPVCYSVYGDEGLIPLFIIISIHSAVLFSVTTIMIGMSDLVFLISWKPLKVLVLIGLLEHPTINIRLKSPKLIKKENSILL